MKLLIAYDGSRCAEAAIDDLRRAGLPADGEATVISVAEVWLPPASSSQAIHMTDDPYIEKMVERHREKGERALAETRTFSSHAEIRLKGIFPSWKIDSRATYGSPGWEILAAADELKPNLIVVGSQGQSAITRFFLGSISQKVLTEAHCSVRVARGRIEVDPAPVRVVIAFDSSRGAQAAVDAVAARNWPEGTEVKMIAVTDPIAPTAIGRFVPPIAESVDEVNESEREWLRELAAGAIEKLQNAGVSATLEILPGNPKKVIVEESEHWNADCIFLGANAFGSKLERFLIGSTSAAVAARAHCSVEVVRIQPE
ncbi:MAG: universal stress protein [Pyrinomonadaceae bacterium]|nr:universal stress protein [Pyrinomonadaceae bacterium]